jgi:hypothetical protein
MKAAANKMFLQWRGSVSSLLSVSLFKFITWDKAQLVGLNIRFAPLLRPPMPATAETQTL